MLNQLIEDPEFAHIKNYFFVDDSIKKSYATDFGHLSFYLPGGVFLPQNINQLQIFIKLANKYKIKMTCRGQGHSMNDHVLSNGGVILDLKKFDGKIEAINTTQGDKLVVPGRD